MKVENIPFIHIQEFLNYAIARNEPSKQLSEIQVAVLYASWEKLSYEQMAARSTYDNGSLGNAASILFKDLSKIFGQKISKNTLHRFIEVQLEDPSCYLHQLQTGVFGNPHGNCYFIGRDKEIQSLENLSLENQCVFVVGSPGIGKTSLVANLYEKYKSTSPYSSLIWYHALDKSVEEDIANLLFDIFREKSEDSLGAFLNFIKSNHSLIILDGIEEWFVIDKIQAERFLRKIIDSNHQSKIILTCDYLPLSIYKLQSTRSMAVLELKGLGYEDCVKLLEEYGLQGDHTQRLIQSFQYNPSYLHHGCKRIKDLFGGKIKSYLQSVTSFAADLMRDDISRIDIRLSDTERVLIKNIVKESLDDKVFLENIVHNIQENSNMSFSQIISGIEMLIRQSLISISSNSSDSEIEVSRAVKKFYFQAL